MRLSSPLAVAAIALAAVSVSACANLSRSAAVAPLDASTSAATRIGEVRLSLDEGVTVTPEFPALFRDRVQARMDQCATGSRPLRLEASISRLERANPAQVLLIGGANVLRGAARLVDPTTGAVVGEYEIGRTVIGSRLSIFQMAESEEQLSDAFGAELCDQAYDAQ